MRFRVILFACATLAAMPAQAQVWGLSGGSPFGSHWRAEQGEARERVRGGDILPLGRVLGEVRRRTPGRLLDAALEDGPGGQPVYRVRWAAEDGRRIDYLVDARSGVILRADGE